MVVGVGGSKERRNVFPVGHGGGLLRDGGLITLVFVNSYTGNRENDGTQQNSITSDMLSPTLMTVVLETRSHWTAFLELNTCKARGEDRKVRNPGFS